MVGLDSVATVQTRARVVTIGVIIAAVATVISVAIAWTSDITAARAETVAVDALGEAGVAAEVERGASSATFTPSDGGSGQPVWQVLLGVGDDTIRVDVHRELGQVVFVDDLVGDGRSERLLDADQWAAVDGYDAPDRWLQRNVLATVAAVWILGAAVALVLRRLPKLPARLSRRRRRAIAPAT